MLSLTMIPSLGLSVASILISSKIWTILELVEHIKIVTLMVVNYSAHPCRAKVNFRMAASLGE